MVIGGAQVDLVSGYRLISTKYPAVSLFDDVADADEFEALYALQELTNPRIQNELGNLELIDRAEIPFGIPGCNMATAPFTHLNPAGSRFSNGTYGVLYIANTMETAISEVMHHQAKYWSNVPALGYDRMVFRGLNCTFADTGVEDLTTKPLSDPIYHQDDYSASHALGAELRRKGRKGVHFWSVRNQSNDGLCWGLFTPRHVSSCVQSALYEMIWSKGITSVSQITSV